MHPFLEPQYDGNDVVFNFSGPAIDELVAFADGYHWAGISLLNQLASSSGLAEPEGYPVLFLYRHALELYLKAIVCQGARLARITSDEEIDTKKILSRHELTPLLPLVKSIFKRVGWDWDFKVSGLKSFGDFKALIIGIERLDRRSYCFRYPINNAGAAAMPRHLMVNVIGFGRKMNPVLERLEVAAMALEEKADAAARAMRSRT